ncbi:retrotransposon protein, putative, ty1-copia subclass [Tanacetum coccineum]
MARSTALMVEVQLALAQYMNNSTIRSIIKKEKLTGPNFMNSYRNLRIVLRVEKRLANLEHPLMPLKNFTNSSVAMLDAYYALYDAQQEVACIMIANIGLNMNCSKQLKHSMLANRSMRKTIAELNDMLKLTKKGLPKKDNAYVILAIRGVPAYGGMVIDVVVIIVMVKSSVFSLFFISIKNPQGAKGSGKGKGKKAYPSKPKIPPPPKKENLTKDPIFHHCKELGHWRRNYLAYLVELKKKKKTSLASTLGVFIIELYFLLKSSGYMILVVVLTYVILRGSKMLKHGALNLYVGHGMREAVKAIRSFEINSSYSIYNVSNKRAKHALDSTYLWHCRLRHINKKRIEKLQHDGILQPTEDESFDKCKSCISRKMARKPFPHQMKRAKDLLGLIHTNVCGTFRTMSREGDSYFITFTGYFSRYGYVYLMKHKHEVFETFKVPRKIKALSKVDFIVHWRIPLRTVESKWLFKKKTDMDCNVHTFKACLVAKGAVDLKSAKQITIAISFTEAGSIVALEAIMEAVWMRKFIDGLGSVVPTNKEPMEMKYHYIREVKEIGEIILNKVNTDDNVVDPFIKPMSLTKHNEHARSIGLRSASSLM